MQEKIGDYIKKSGHLNELAISVYVNALVQNNVESLNREVLEHVEECSLCRSSILENYRLFKAIEDEGLEVSSDLSHNQVQINPNKRTLRFGILLKIAAIAIILISVGYLLIFSLSYKNNEQKEQLSRNVVIENATKEISADNKKNRTEIEELKIKEGSGKEEEVELVDENAFPDMTNLIAANFEESSSLENFIDINVRSCDDVHVISPELSRVYNYGEIIEFIWKAEIKDPLILKIYTNKEKLILQEKNIPKSKFIYKEKLEPGLYYWKLETEDDLYFTGKFLVNK